VVFVVPWLLTGMCGMITTLSEASERLTGAIVVLISRMESFASFSHSAARASRSASVMAGVSALHGVATMLADGEGALVVAAKMGMTVLVLALVVVIVEVVVKVAVLGAAVADLRLAQQARKDGVSLTMLNVSLSLLSAPPSMPVTA